MSQDKPLLKLFLLSIYHYNSLPGGAQTEVTLVKRSPQGGLSQFLCCEKPVWTGQNVSLLVKGYSDVWLRISGAFWTLSKPFKGNLCLDKKQKLGLCWNYPVSLDYLVSDVSSKCRVLNSLLGGYSAVSIRGLVWWIKENTTQYKILWTPLIFLSQLTIIPRAFLHQKLQNTPFRTFLNEFYSPRLPGRAVVFGSILQTTTTEPYRVWYESNGFRPLMGSSALKIHRFLIWKVSFSVTT